jgi:ribosome-associated protein
MPRRHVIESLEKAKHIREMLDSKKAQDIVLIDVRNQSTITDFYLIASGMSSPHLKAMYGDVKHQLKQEKEQCYRSSGSPEAGWMVLDYVDVIIHLFSPEAREYYAIESLWDQAPRID